MSLNMKVEQMYNFHQFELPTAIKHGIGYIKHIDEEVKNLGASKVLLVTDPGINNAGVTAPVEKHLKEAVIEIVLFNKLEPNPPVRLIAEGSKLFKEENCNGLVAVGGGSFIATVTGIGVEAT